MLGPRHIVTHNNSLADTDHSTESRGRSREGGKSYFSHSGSGQDRDTGICWYTRERGRLFAVVTIIRRSQTGICLMILSTDVFISSWIRGREKRVPNSCNYSTYTFQEFYISSLLINFPWLNLLGTYWHWFLDPLNWLKYKRGKTQYRGEIKTLAADLSE